MTLPRQLRFPVRWIATLALSSAGGCGLLFVEEMPSPDDMGPPDVPSPADARDLQAMDGDASSDRGTVDARSEDALSDGALGDDAEEMALELGPDMADASGPSLTNRGLLLRYFLDEAGLSEPRLSSDGRLPLSSRGTTSLEALSLPTGRGIRFGARSRDDGYCNSEPSVLISELSGTTGTIEMVATLRAGVEPGSRLVETGARQLWSFTLAIAGAVSSGDLRLEFIMNESRINHGEWPIVGGSRHVYTVTVDTMQADSQERVRLYIDGVRVPNNDARSNESGSDSLPQGTPIEIAEDARTCIGNRYLDELTGGARTPEGEISYAAYYRSALTPDEVAANAARLLANDDTR
ncbi:MAG: hypothetical protein AAF938_14540 [Myxococcota bacterium]